MAQTLTYTGTVYILPPVYASGEEWCMSRVSISLPDELMTRLEPLKKGINVSQVCREALERRIAIFEQATVENGADLDTVGLIDRLREERALVESKVEDLGRRNAAAWLATASYLELKSVLEEQATGDITKYRLPKTAFRAAKVDLRETVGGFNGLPAVAYKTAWLDYVKAIWDRVKNDAEVAEETQTAEATD